MSWNLLLLCIKNIKPSLQWPHSFFFFLASFFCFVLLEKILCARQGQSESWGKGMSFELNRTGGVGLLRGGGIHIWIFLTMQRTWKRKCTQCVWSTQPGDSLIWQKYSLQGGMGCWWGTLTHFVAYKNYQVDIFSPYKNKADRDLISYLVQQL